MKRIGYIDTAKGYLMLLVILGHTLIVLNPGYDRLYLTVTEAFISVFHMPAFFIIHGIIFNTEKWKHQSVKKFVIRKVQTLLVPYVFFEIVGIIWMRVFTKQPLLKGLYNLVTLRCNIGADWFLPAMFLGSLLFLIYVKHPNLVYGILSTVICFVLPMTMREHQFLVVIGRGMLAYGFIMIGSLLKPLFQSEKCQSSLWLIISLFVTVGVAISGLKWAGNDFYSCTVNNPATFAFGGISGTVLIFGISRILHCKLITDYIGKHTLSIMGTHQLMIYAMTAMIPSLYGGTILYGLLLLVAIMIFEIPVVCFLDHHMKCLTGR